MSKNDQCKLHIISESIQKVLSEKKKIKIFKCKYCGQEKENRCCIWKSYFKQHKNEDWESDQFKNFVIDSARAH
jgi:hypothetical protein